MIRHSINIMRGCFGGCTFLFHHRARGRIIQNRSEDSIIREVEKSATPPPPFTGVISDLGGPTANMWRLACKSKSGGRLPPAELRVPGICKTSTPTRPADQPVPPRPQRARNQKVLIASGCATTWRWKPRPTSRNWSLTTWRLPKIAPNTPKTARSTKMMKPGIGSVTSAFAACSKSTEGRGKEQYLIPYFIAAHPGTSDRDMMNLALWLKRNKFRADQVQTFYPSPMASATAMYYSGKNPLKRVTRGSDTMPTIKNVAAPVAQGIFALPRPGQLARPAPGPEKLGRADLIGTGKLHLVPPRQPARRHQTVLAEAWRRWPAVRHPAQRPAPHARPAQGQVENQRLASAGVFFHPSPHSGEAMNKTALPPHRPGGRHRPGGADRPERAQDNTRDLRTPGLPPCGIKAEPKAEYLDVMPPRAPLNRAVRASLSEVSGRAVWISPRWWAGVLLPNRTMYCCGSTMPTTAQRWTQPGPRSNAPRWNSTSPGMSCNAPRAYGQEPRQPAATGRPPRLVGGEANLSESRAADQAAGTWLVPN